MRTLLAKAVWIWFLFLFMAVLNGLARETVYIPNWGDLWGRVAGTGILVLAMLVVTYVFLRRNAGLLTRVRLFEVALLWLGLSLFFELAVSRWVMEEPWEMIIAHYDVTAGRMRVLVRIVEFLAPILLGGRVLARAQQAAIAPAEEAPVPEADQEKAEPVPENAESTQS